MLFQRSPSVQNFREQRNEIAPKNGFVTMSEYDNYFKNRAISDDYYEDYIIPAYLLNALPCDKNFRILDIGCGVGQLLAALRKEGYVNIVGIDVSSEAIDLCMRRELPVEQVNDLITFCKGAKSQYDLIVMSHIVEHLPKTEIIETLRLIRTKLLTEGGALIVLTPNAQSNTGSYWAYEDFTHTVIFTAGSLFFVLKEAGFKQVRFLDPQGVEGSMMVMKFVRKFFLLIYRMRIAFWNRITRSSFHRPSPQIFTYELKALAK